MNKFYKLMLLLSLSLGVLHLAYSQVPLSPANLHVEQGMDGGAILRWDTSATALFYKIYKAIDGSSFVNIASTDRHSFFDWAVGPGHGYHYFVRAFNESGGSDPSDTVHFHLAPPPPPEVHGVISGTITDDSTGRPIKEAVVRFFNINRLWTVRTYTDSGGSYRIPLDTGKYFIRTEKYNYVPEWFDDALRLENATVVELHQDTMTANVGLRPVPAVSPVNVSGTVTDSANGNPLPNTLVAFFRPHHTFRALEVALGILGGFDFERFFVPGFGDLRGVVWVGLTDTAGHYAARLLPYHKYIAVAFKPGFLPKFYDNKYTPFDADRIFVTGDTSGIDFAIVKNPNTLNSISGTVVDSSGLGIPSHVVLIRLTALGPLPVRYRMTDSLGNYDFHNLVAGNFLIRAVPLNDYAPAWYSAARCGVSNWHDADTIHVAGNRSGVDICVNSVSSDGFSTIAGTVSNPTNLAAMSPAQGVTVYAVSSATGDVVGYDVTEEDGSFSIENLEPGTFHLVVDKEGHTTTNTSSYTVDVSNNYAISDATITLTPETPTSVDGKGTNIPEQFRLDQNYPNPFNPMTTIRFEVPKTSIVNLKIYNLIGQEITTLTNTTLNPGVYTVQWNGFAERGNVVSSGVYFVKLTARPVDGGVQFVRIRKVALMK